MINKDALIFRQRFLDALDEWHDAEDLFYCLKLRGTSCALNIPGINEAIHFAFERSPRYLYFLNGNKLPFGCHAWKTYDYEFWQNYIEVEKDKL